MSEYFFDTEQPTVSVAGSDRLYPVHSIYCVGRNYAAHTREMGGDPKDEPPVFFLKPADAVVPGGAKVAYPPCTADLHHEIELVVAIGRPGREIDVKMAEECIFGYAVGIDLTRRDLQAQAKEKGGPWDTAKSFEGAAPVSPIHRVEDTGHPSAGRVWLAVNGEIRQDGDIGDMIRSVPEIIAELSTLFTLAAGDLIYTGTPEGVGAVKEGDRITGGVEGIDEISIEIVSR
ncbi:MAG: fumarylacetoacetate hydrolase family protein [Woeseia sp.]